MDKLRLHMIMLESGLRKLTASWHQNEVRLTVKIQTQHSLRGQREKLKKELLELGEDCSISIQHLKEEIAIMEEKIEGS